MCPKYVLNLSRISVKSSCCFLRLSRLLWFFSKLFVNHLFVYGFGQIFVLLILQFEKNFWKHFCQMRGARCLKKQYCFFKLYLGRQIEKRSRGRIQITWWRKKQRDDYKGNETIKCWRWHKGKKMSYFLYTGWMLQVSYLFFLESIRYIKEFKWQHTWTFYVVLSGGFEMLISSSIFTVWPTL